MGSEGACCLATLGLSRQLITTPQQLRVHTQTPASPMEHYLEYAPTKRVTKASFPRKIPAKDYAQPVTTPWVVALPPGSLATLLMGFSAQIMDHKWHVYAEGPDADGKVDVHFLRSWTGNPIVTARIETARRGGAEGERPQRRRRRASWR
ncbi:hypothetical protein ACCO45_006558 [Purpureocillium lilacinum]|uniref:Uncharacterized protein n=1 Tax=Purpureocillium lilacinum TaxID=33203 RepID=A0ACC4DPU3_PURLI